MKNYDVVIIDDDEDLAMIAKDLLEDEGYEVKWLESGEEGYEFLKDNTAKLIILDINLPGDTGFEFCKELRKNSTVPVIFVSARTSENDRITGLDLGGDDYLPKPYSLAELLSRVRALMRRTYGFQTVEKKEQFGSVTVDLATRKVSKNGAKVDLSLKEYDLLVYFLKHPNEAISKEALLAEVWGAFSEVEISTVAVHMRWLREKLEENPSKPEHFKTVWGVGYCFEK